MNFKGKNFFYSQDQRSPRVAAASSPEQLADGSPFVLHGAVYGGLDAESSLLEPDELEATAFVPVPLEPEPGIEIRGQRPYVFMPVGILRSEVSLHFYFSSLKRIFALRKFSLCFEDLL